VVPLAGPVASTAPEVLVPQAGRLRLVALVHMPLGHDPAHRDARRREGEVLAAVASVVTTSPWARRTLLELYGLPGDRVHVAEPGVDAADLAPGTTDGGALLCVAAVIPGKGHDVLCDALATLTDMSWRCLCAGRLDRDPTFADGLRRRILDRDLSDRVTLPGPLVGADLARSYGAADLLVLASRGETYGMVVTEALARALPVLATDVGGVREALGNTPTGPAGLLVAADEPALLAAALRRWLTDEELRDRLRGAAARRRRTLPSWQAASGRVGNVLAEAAA
jgi:glycosyltransferase involved in cell wall biosynthesis